MQRNNVQPESGQQPAIKQDKAKTTAGEQAIKYSISEALVEV